MKHQSQTPLTVLADWLNAETSPVASVSPRIYGAPVITYRWAARRVCITSHINGSCTYQRGDGPSSLIASPEQMRAVLCQIAPPPQNLFS